MGDCVDDILTGLVMAASVVLLVMCGLVCSKLDLSFTKALTSSVIITKKDNQNTSTLLSSAVHGYV